MQALQQRGPCAAPKEVQNPPAGAAEDQKSGIAYTDQDRKILQLCGEDSARAGPGGEAGSNLAAALAGPCGGRALFGVGGA